MDPSYINYEDEPDESASGWTHSVFRQYWYNVYEAAYAARPRWGVKEATLLTRLMREYDAETLAEMMELAVKNEPYHSFAAFYSCASNWHKIWKDKNEWKWT